MTKPFSKLRESLSESAKKAVTKAIESMTKKNPNAKTIKRLKEIAEKCESNPKEFPEITEKTIEEMERLRVLLMEAGFDLHLSSGYENKFQEDLIAEMRNIVRELCTMRESIEEFFMSHTLTPKELEDTVKRCIS